jgi:branched-chain amino acid transport system substrate-binding protein
MLLEALNMKKIRRFLAALLATGLLLAGAAIAQEPIPIGWVGPLSPPGGYAAGQLMRWAAELAQDEINQSGGVLGRPIRVIFEDTRGQPEQGTAAMQRLVSNEKVVAAFGEFHSSVALAEIEVAHRNKVPFIASEVWADEVTARQYPEVFRIAPANSLIYTVVADWVAEVGFENVAIVQETTDWGEGAVSVLTGEFDERGINYTVSTAELSQQDFTSQILRLLNQNPRPDILMQLTAGEGSYRLSAQACELGFAPTSQTALYSGGGPSLQPEFWENVGDCGVHLVTEFVGLPPELWNDKTKAFVEAFEERFDRAPDAAAMESYDSLYLIVEAIRQADSTDADAVIDALENISWEGTRGEYTFSLDTEPAWAYHQFMSAPVLLIQYSELNQEPAASPIVWPNRWATSEKLYVRP